MSVQRLSYAACSVLLAIMLTPPLPGTAQSESLMVDSSGPATGPAVGDGAGTFTGRWELAEFRADGDRVVGEGTLEGFIRLPDGGILPVVDQVVQIPMIGLQVNPSCTRLVLDPGAVALDNGGPTVDLTPLVLDAATPPMAPTPLGPLLCEIATLHEQPPSATTAAALAEDLTHLIRLIG